MAKKISRIIKRQLAMLLAVAIVAALLPTAVLAGDYDGHWAQESIDRAVELGWFIDENATRPNDSITRAEFVTIVNRMKGYTGTADLSDYPDVNQDAWYYGAFAAAVANGYIKGSDGMLLPDKSISRNEAVTILARISQLDTTENTTPLSGVKDFGKIPEWAQTYVSAAVMSGLIAGFDGMFSGERNITRAETAVLLERLYDEIRTYGFAGTYTGTAHSAVIMASGVTLSDMKITKDLTIDGTVGDGEVTLDNVSVGSTLYINGGGAKSVYIKGGSFNEIIINKPSVHVVMSDGTDVTHMSAESAAASILMGSDVAIETIMVSPIAKNTVILTASSSSIGTVTISAEGTGITGTGSITTANIKAENVVIGKKPTNTNIDNGISALVGGVTVTGGGSTGGGGIVTPQVRVKSISLDVSELTIQIGQTAKLTGTILPENATNKAITWISSDETVAEVSGGTITPVSVGRTVIMAKTADGGFTALADVKVTEAIIDSNTVPLSTYNGDVIIRVGSEDIDLTDIQFNGNVTIEKEEPVEPGTFMSPVVPLSFMAGTQEIPVIAPFSASGKVNFKGSTKIAGEGKSLVINAETEVAAEENTVIGKIDAKKDASLNLSGTIDKINVAGAVTLNKLTVSGGANPEVTGGGEVKDVEVKGAAGNNSVGLTITAKVGKVNVVSDAAGDTIGTLNIGGNNTDTEVNIKNVTVNRVVVTDTASPVILVDANSILETVTALSNSTTGQTRIEGEGAVNKLQTISNPNQEEGFESVSIAVTGGEEPDTETIDPVLKSIEISSLPAKMNYLVDEEFDSTGISVTGSYLLEDGAVVRRDVRNFTVSEMTLTTVGSKTVTVTAESDDSVKATFSITVRADKSALSAAITGAKAAVAIVAVSQDGTDINPGKNWVTPSAMTAVNTAIAAAAAVNGKQGASQDEVDDAVTALNNALDAFDEQTEDGQKEGADKASLTGIITTARNTAESTVTSSAGGRDLEPGVFWVSPGKMQALNDAIAAANLVFNNNESTQEMIDSAVSALTTALGNFTASKTEAQTDKNALSQAISDANDAKQYIKTYDESTTGDSWVPTEAMTALNNTISAAQKVFDNGKSTQIEIDNAAAELEKAAGIFKNQITTSVLDTTPLSSAIAAANAAKSGVETSEDGTDVDADKKWVSESAMTAFENAISAAEAVLIDGNLTQGKVVSAVTVLKAATVVFNNSKQDGVKPTVTDVSVSPESETAAVGETLQLTASVTGLNNPALTVTWSSSDESLATVDSNGLVTAVAPGEVTITATSTYDTSKSGSAAITVTAEAQLVNGGDTEYYALLKDALDASGTSGDEITLLSDASLTEASEIADGVTLIIPADKTLTADSNLTVSGTLTVTGNLTVGGTLKVIMATGNISGYSGAIEWHAAGAWELKSALEKSAAGDTIMINSQIGADVADTCVLHAGINSGSSNDYGYYNFRVKKPVTIKASGDFTIYGNFTLGLDDGSPVEGAEFIGLTIVTPRLRFSGNPGSSKVFLYAIGGVTNDITITDCKISTSSTVYTGSSGYGYDCVYRGISLVPTENSASGIDYNITGTDISFNQSAFSGVTTPIVSGLSGIAVMSSLYGNENSNWSGRYPGVTSPGTFGAQSAEDAVEIFDELVKLERNTTGENFPEGVDIAVWHGPTSAPGQDVVTPGSRADYDID